MLKRQLIYFILFFISSSWIDCFANFPSQRIDLPLQGGSNSSYPTNFDLTQNGYIVSYKCDWYGDDVCNIIYKFDTLGNALWTRTFPISANYTSAAGDTICTANYSPPFVFNENDSNAIWVYLTDSSTTINAVQIRQKFFTFTKTGTNGNNIWTHQTELDSIFNLTGSQVCHAPNGKFFLYSSNYVLKCDSAGQMLWCKFFSDSSRISISKLLPSQTEDIWMAGNRGNEFYLVKLNDVGTTIWSEKLTAPNALTNTCITFTVDSFILILLSTNNPNVGVLLSKLDTSGNVLFTKNILDSTLTASTQLLAISPDSIITFSKNTYFDVLDSNFNLIGSTYSREYYNDGISSTSYTPMMSECRNGNIYDILLLDYNDFHWGYEVISIFLQHIQPNGSYCGSPQPHFFSTALYQLNSTFLSIQDSIYCVNRPFTSLSIAEYFVTTVGGSTYCIFDNLVNDNNPDLFSVYPNPSSNDIHIKFESMDSKEVVITDALGKELIHKFNTTETEFNYLSESKGLFIVKVVQNGQLYTKKVIII